MNRQERRVAGKRAANSGAVAQSLAPHQSDPDALFATALGHHRAGRALEAEQTCRAILARHPSHVPSLTLIAGAAQRAGRNRNAIKMLRSALDIDDRDASAHDTIAMAYEALGQREDAMRHFTLAIKCGLNVELHVKQRPEISACLGRLRGSWPQL
jgi:Tfp pilus assembly protein PilF